MEGNILLFVGFFLWLMFFLLRPIMCRIYGNICTSNACRLLTSQTKGNFNIYVSKSVCIFQISEA